MMTFYVELGVQNGSGNVALPVSDTSNNSNHSEDVEGYSGDILNDPNLCSNFLQYVDPGEQNSLMLNENMLSNANDGDVLNTSSPTDGFLELKDFADATNYDNPFGNDSTVWSSDGWAWKTDGTNGANNEVPLNNGEETFESEELEQLLQSLQDDGSPLGSTITDVLDSSISNSVNLADDSLMFYDAPFDSTMFNDAFRQPIEFLGSPVTNISGINMAEDGMLYYDAMDDTLFNETLCPMQQSAGSNSHVFNGPVLTQEVNNTAYTYIPTQKVLEPNFVVGTAPSSARLPETAIRSNCVILPDSQVKNGSIGKRFVKMLDSISAPPAFAAEFPANLHNSLASISGALPNTISMSTEISIESLTVASRQDKWSFQKGEDMELLFPMGFEPDNRVQCGCNSITAVFRGGFCLFFVSAIMLLASYGVGLCIYCK